MFRFTTDQYNGEDPPTHTLSLSHTHTTDQYTGRTSFLNVVLMSGTFSCPALYGMWYGEGRGGWCGWGSTELGSTWYRMGEEATSWMLCFNGARMMVLLTRCWWGGHRTAFVFIIASFFTVFKAATQEQGFNKRSAWHFLYLY